MKYVSCHPSVRAWTGLAATVMLLSTSACTSVGPGTGRVVGASKSQTMQGIQIITLDEDTARNYVPPTPVPFSQALGQSAPYGQVVGIGDAIMISIWEAPPAVLFGGAGGAAGAATEVSRQVSLPDYLVGNSGRINVPFAGSVPVLGRTPEQIERDIAARLSQKAHMPQVNVRISRTATATVSVVGDVTSNVLMPLSPKGEKILDALAAAQGTRESTNKVTIRVSRDSQVYSMPLESIINDPQQNVTLRAGDVVTALSQPYSFTALGATGRNEEVRFESTGLSLAQALGRLGGLVDGRADPRGVFIFRWENPSSIPHLANTAVAGPDGRIPVIYRANMKDPATYFAMQHFLIRDRDLLYVANNPVSDFQRFVGIIASTALPVITVDNALRR